MAKKHKPSEHCYGTKREIDFIKRIGTHTTGKIEKSKLELLQSYYNAALGRSNWDGLNRERILSVAYEEIQKEKG